MLIDIRAIGFGLTEGIRRHVESRLKAALAPFAHRIVTVTARVEDVNARRGGVDKRCSIVAAIRRNAVIVAEAVHVDLYAAADEAAARLRRSVQRRLKRHVAQERKNPRRPGTLVAA